jgi:putative glutamine amidotransferase
MRPRIAIPLPHSGDAAYVERSLPHYEKAVEDAGGEPVRIPLDQPRAEILKLMQGCEGVLLPGSRADVDPAKYSAQKSPSTNAADSKRNAVDEVLLDDAYDKRKPVLAICYGLQSLNVYRQGTLVQHLADSLPAQKRALVDHEAGRAVIRAHEVVIDPSSKLASIVAAAEPPTDDRGIVVEVNSSHHQAVDKAGSGLRIVARSPLDDVIEALENTSPDHFVVAVQWHPERGSQADRVSQEIFRALVQAAQARQQAGESRATGA